MRLYIIRHAHPDYANDTITSTGHLEAAALAERMKKISPDRLYSSPLGRAMATARYSAEALGKPFEVLPWTAELGNCRFSIDAWGEMVVWDTPGELIRESQPFVNGENWFEHPQFKEYPLFRATFDCVKENSDAFFASLGYRRQAGRYEIVQASREKIAVFCHGGFGLWWLAHLLEIPLPLMWAGFHLPPTSVTTVLFDERSARWATPRCIGMGDVSHLYAAGLEVQPSGIIANRE